MTVTELISHLKTLPEDAQIYVADWSEEYAYPFKLEPKNVALRRREIIPDDAPYQIGRYAIRATVVIIDS
jgi:hypothetical protein